MVWNVTIWGSFWSLNFTKAEWRGDLFCLFLGLLCQAEMERSGSGPNTHYLQEHILQKFYMTITEFHITSLQFHMNITPCKAPLHCYLWKMTFGYGDRGGGGALPQHTHTPQQLSNTSILCSFLVCEFSRFSDLRSERRRNPSEFCVSVFFPLFWRWVSYAKLRDFVQYVFWKLFFWWGRGVLEFSFKIRRSPERVLECSVVMACGFRT